MFQRISALAALIGLCVSGCTLSNRDGALVYEAGFTTPSSESAPSGSGDTENEMLNLNDDDLLSMQTAIPPEPATTGDGQSAPTIEVTATTAINPLTGLPAGDPESLSLPPALVSVTNFPPTARPQAGLSYSPIVFEMFIGDGMTRFLAVFYGDYPDAAQSQNEAVDTKGSLQAAGEPVIGPIRSGRLPYESIRRLYSGFIVMASAYTKVMDELNEFVNVVADDRMDINSALIDVSELKGLAASNREELGGAQLTGMRFDPQPPADGKTAYSMWIFFSYLNQVFWRYHPADGSYRRWQDDADGSTFTEQTDRLNGQPLAFENVIILFADHEVNNKYLIDIHLLYVNRGKAKLMRDGQIYDLYWTTKSEDYEQTTGKFRPIRFIDAEGNPFPLKPGQTWIEIVPNHIACWETVDSEKYNQLAAGRSKGSGYWGLYFKLDD